MNDSRNNSCVSTELSLTERNILLYILGGGSAFSTLICVIALFITCYYRLYKRFAHRLVIYQLLSAIIFSLVCSAELSFLNFNYDDSPMIMKALCGAVGFLLSVTIGIKFIITFCLTFHLFMFAVFLKDLYRLEPLYVITSFGIPLLFDWIPFVNGLYGLTGAWCWIKNWKGNCPNDKIMIGTIEQYAFEYAPGIVLFFIDLILIIVTIGVLLYRSYCRDCHPVKEAAEYDPLLKRQAERQKKALKEILPLISYPIIFMILFLPSLIQRIYGAIVPEAERYFVFVLQAITVPCWSLFVGCTVIIHIFIMKCCGIPIDPKPLKTSLVGMTEYNPIYTADTVAATDAKTYFSAPHESELWQSDNDFEN